ncbi:MAG TPA: hypothetical protein VFE85_04510 [Woeseiaceae bacterium]|nr:hypothetical protein [Woeseiaceae bacterium]
MYRLKKPHSRHLDAPPADAGRLLREQSPGRAWLAGAGALVLVLAAWVAVSMLFDRYFPWYSMLQGLVIGLAVQRHGRGLDWRFPGVAALLTAVAAFAGAFLVALFLTGREFRTGALALVDEISWHTVSVFAIRNFGVDGVIYMLFAAAVAAFYAPRRLSRQEAVALRRYREEDRA